MTKMNKSRNFDKLILNVMKNLHIFLTPNTLESIKLINRLINYS